MRAKCWVY